ELCPVSQNLERGVLLCSWHVNPNSSHKPGMRTNGAAFFRWQYAIYAIHFFSTMPGKYSRPCCDVGRIEWVCPSCGVAQRKNKIGTHKFGSREFLASNSVTP